MQRRFARRYRIRLNRNRREKAGPSSGLAGTAGAAEINRTRASVSLRRRRARTKTPEAPRAWTVTSAFARPRARSRQLHNGTVGPRSLVLLPPSFLSGGPARNVGPSVARIPRVSPLAYARALSFPLTSSPRCPTPESPSRRSKFSVVSLGSGTTTIAFVIRREEADHERVRKKKRKQRRKRTPTRHDRWQATALDRTSATRCRPRTSNRLNHPPTDSGTTYGDTTRGKTRRISSRERPTDYPRRSLSVQGPGAARLRDDAARDLPESTSDISNYIVKPVRFRGSQGPAVCGIRHLRAPCQMPARDQSIQRAESR
ncbi:hypothetical protein DMN91_002788 [Ooceraea biroi]|uniref:Uncharacterized protein n=1 Tax=Ooceraea biroi TaxID=2015173 RepID=A0A3L8DXM9_OOCBI|nr:hypothetical protein DMN91_002788 [Ooceraea biroi]